MLVSISYSLAFPSLLRILSDRRLIAAPSSTRTLLTFFPSMITLMCSGRRCVLILSISLLNSSVVISFGCSLILTIYSSTSSKYSSLKYWGGLAIPDWVGKMDTNLSSMDSKSSSKPLSKLSITSLSLDGGLFRNIGSGGMIIWKRKLHIGGFDRFQLLWSYGQEMSKLLPILSGVTHMGQILRKLLWNFRFLMPHHILLLHKLVLLRLPIFLQKHDPFIQLSGILDPFVGHYIP